MQARSIFLPDILKGRAILVTGGGSGIGKEIAVELARFGAKVCVMGRRAKMLEETVQEIESFGGTATFFIGDVRKEASARDAVKKCVDTFGHLDTLVTGNFLAAAEGLSTKGFQTVLDIDTVGTFNMTHASFEELKKSGCGKIINISANLHHGATWYQIHASAAKAAIDSMTRTWALEWGEYGIRCAGIAPGPIADTTGMDKLSAFADKEQMDAMQKISCPIQRFGTKQEMAALAIYLVSPAGDYITADGAERLMKPQVVPREMIPAKL